MKLKRQLQTERQLRKATEQELADVREQLQLLKAQTSRAADEVKLIEVTSLAQAELVRRIIDNSPNLVYVENEQRQCVLANQSYNRLLSACRTGQPQRQDIASSELLTAPTAFEESFVLNDERVVWYYTTKAPLVQSDGARYLVTFSTDITELKRAQSVAEESVQAKQLFMANMSHEIRTPLHGILGLSELLRKQQLSDEQADFVHMIQTSTENLLVVINDVLDFSRIESGNISLENIPFSVSKTIYEIVRLLTFKIAEKGLQLQVVGLEQAIPMVQGDPYRLRQVLVNLVSNAIKFTQQGRITITVETGPADEGTLPVSFRVADTGIGIEPDSLNNIFQSFQQADNSIPRLYGGTGLGLSICKNLIELQGGQIGVSSILGQGSCFHFTIPYLLSEASSVEQPDSIPQPDLLRGLHVLLVEDNSINQLIAFSMLSSWEVEVDIAQNGEEAITKARSCAYDLILMDIQMPQLDGLEATAQLQADAGINQRTPIIAVTADAIRVNPHTCQALGFAYCLLKPYTEAGLYTMLLQVTQRVEGTATHIVGPAESSVNVVVTPLEPQYDFAMLGKLASNPVFVRQMLELFVTRVPEQFVTLQAALERNEWNTIGLEAHKLKSIFGSFNIQPGTTQLKRLEEAATLGTEESAEECARLVHELQQTADSFTNHLTKELAAMVEKGSNPLPSYQAI